MDQKPNAPDTARPETGKGTVSEEALSRYAWVLLDSIFKKIFGTEANKDMLIMLLEAVIPGRKIRDIRYTNTVKLNNNLLKHDSIFDVECIDADTGERFDVELQVAQQDFFYERALFYSSFMIEDQLDKGKKLYDYPPVYVIGLLNFKIHKPEEGFRFSYRLREDTTGELMTKNLNFIFLELPNARDLSCPDLSLVEKMCYALQNMETFNDRPKELMGKFFERLFELAEIATFDPQERIKYEHEMTTERDRLNQLAFAEKKGRQEGETKKALEIAKSILAAGQSVAFAAQVTGLTLEQLEQFKEQ